MFQMELRLQNNSFYWKSHGDLMIKLYKKDMLKYI